MQTLLTSADKAFARGENQQGLSLLREYNQSNNHDPGAWHRQAVIEEQIGDQALAGHAHYRSIKMAPDIGLGYLYAGYWLQQNKKIEAAAAAYSLLSDISPETLTLSKESPTSLTKRVIAANQVLRSVLSQLHRDLCSQTGLGRVRNSIWVRTHDESFKFDRKHFNPQLFYVPEIPQKPFHSPSHFTWANSVVSKTKTIQAELSAALQDSAATQTIRPYLAKGYNHGPLQELAGSTNWSALDLYKEGQENVSITAKFPETLKALKSVPTYSLEKQPYEIFFSLLKPHQKIAPHHGLSNHALTVHLALDVPNNCFLKVSDQQKSWTAGELLIFDDSFLHSAHNESEQLRIVLIFSIWNPALNPAEQRAIQASFNARRNWLDMRVSKLDQLTED